jgi:hypothetical protein
MAQKTDSDAYLQAMSQVLSQAHCAVSTDLATNPPKDYTFRISYKYSNHIRVDAVSDDTVLASFLVDTYCMAHKVMLSTSVTCSICQPLNAASLPFRALSRIMELAMQIDTQYLQLWNQEQ